MNSGNPILCIALLQRTVASRHKALWLGLPLLLCLSGVNAIAQEVTRVYPRYAVVGQVVQFTVEGKRLPVKNSPTKGLRHGFGKPNGCISNKPTHTGTPTRYHFACTFKPGVTNTRLSITNKARGKAATVLWEGTIQVLPAAPAVDSVTVTAEHANGQARVDCPPGKTCVTTLGELRATRPALIEVTGSNLPASLLVNFAGCRKSSSDDETTNLQARAFPCLLRNDGQQALRILSAPGAEGGKILSSISMLILPPPAEASAAPQLPAQ